MEVPTLLKVVGSKDLSECLLTSALGKGRMRLMRRISRAAALAGETLLFS